MAVVVVVAAAAAYTHVVHRGTNCFSRRGHLRFLTSILKPKPSFLELFLQNSLESTDASQNDHDTDMLADGKKPAMPAKTNPQRYTADLYIT